MVESVSEKVNFPVKFSSLKSLTLHILVGSPQVSLSGFERKRFMMIELFVIQIMMIEKRATSMSFSDSEGIY